MRCPHCSLEIPIGQQFCGGCGKRVNVGFDDIQDSVLSDAADRRSVMTEKILLNAIGGFIVLWVGIKLLNDYYLETEFPAGKSVALSFAAPTSKVRQRNQMELKLQTEELAVPRVGRVEAQGMSWRRDPFKSSLRTAECTSPEAETVKKAISSGLAYLARRQKPDGSWHIRQENGSAGNWARPGVTGLALLALMGNGETWLTVRTDDAGKAVSSKYGGKVKSGVNYLTSIQALDGEDVGLIGPKKNHYMYNQGYATAALCEAYATSGDPYLGRAARKAVNYIISAQQKSGGWDYYSKPGPRADTSVTCCQLMALFTAQQAGIKVPEQVFEKGLKFIDSLTDPKTFNVGYDKRWARSEEGQRFGATAMALATQLYLGRSPSTEAIRRQAKRLSAFRLPAYNAKWKKEKKAAVMDYYYIYHGTMAFHRLGGDQWVKWNKAMIKTLASSQQRGGYWPLFDSHSQAGGRIYSTATAVLSLEVYSRYP
jgi:Prenyltransferase and squalene oxidase repeat